VMMSQPGLIVSASWPVCCVMMSQPGLIVSASWPVTQPVDEVVIKSSAYLMEVVHDLRKRLKAATEPRKV